MSHFDSGPWLMPQQMPAHDDILFQESLADSLASSVVADKQAAANTTPQMPTTHKVTTFSFIKAQEQQKLFPYLVTHTLGQKTHCKKFSSVKSS